jgi:hypothetical protein
MPSQARLDAPGALHHVVIRGIERGSIVHTCKKTLGTLVRRKIQRDMKLTWVTKEVNWRHAKANETAWKLEYTGASVARLSEVKTASVNRMAGPEGMTELDAWDK